MTFIPGLNHVFYEGDAVRSRIFNIGVYSANWIIDPLKDTNLKSCIVKESPETVESWRETQVKLGNIHAERQRNFQDTRVKGKPFHQLKEKKNGKNI